VVVVFGTGQQMIKGVLLCDGVVLNLWTLHVPPKLTGAHRHLSLTSALACLSIDQLRFHIELLWQNQQSWQIQLFTSDRTLGGGVRFFYKVTDL
jgi:hypothetical protein